jgi:hypothetical protein
VRTLSPELAYRPLDRLAFRARVPVHWKTYEEISVHEERNGLGDVELLGSFEVVHAPAEQPADIRSLTVGAGLTLPTGETEAQPFVGNVAPTPLQLGSGTVDPLLTISASRRFGDAWAIAAGGAARLAVMQNRHDYEPSSVVEAGMGVAWSPWPDRVAFDFQVEWSHLGRASVAGYEATSTGRGGVYLEPGASARLGRRLRAGAIVRLPVYLRVNETQFTEDFLLAVRLAYRTSPPAAGE